MVDLEGGRAWKQVQCCMKVTAVGVVSNAQDLDPSTTVGELKQKITTQLGGSVGALTFSRHPSGQPLGGDDRY